MKDNKRYQNQSSHLFMMRTLGAQHVTQANTHAQEEVLIKNTTVLAHGLRVLLP